jgi:hypothetical protein
MRRTRTEDAITAGKSNIDSASQFTLDYYAA